MKVDQSAGDQSAGVVEGDGVGEDAGNFYVVKEKRVNNSSGHGTFLSKLGWTPVEWQHDSEGNVISQFGEDICEIAFFKLVSL